MLPLRLNRASRTTLLTGSLLALIGFPLVLLTLIHTDPTGSARPLSLFPTWATRQPLTPTSLVLKGELVGKGLDWKDRLVEGEVYFTAGVIGGVTNLVMSAANLIHIALLTDRVPIIPPMMPYVPQMGGPLVTLPMHDLPFSEIFDVPRLFDILHRSHGMRGILEWDQLVNFTVGYDLKPDEDPTVPGWRAFHGGQWNETEDWVELGCWAAHTPGLIEPLRRVRIKPTFTDLPPAVLKRPEVHLPSLTSYLHRDSPLRSSYLAALEGTVPANLLPDQTVACIDNAYYAHVTNRFVSSEWAGEGGTQDVGAWPAVGTHMHWNPVLQARADQVARWVFGVSEKEEVPQFVSVHIRHGDFLDFCPKPPAPPSPSPDPQISLPPESAAGPPTQSPPPLEQAKPTCLSGALFHAAVTAQQTTLWRESGSSVRNVLFTTDDEDDNFLAVLEGEYGWRRVREEVSLRVRAEWGDWYPTLIDQALLSMGKAFVGTQSSTMSILSARRVEDWNDAPPSIYVQHASDTWVTVS